MFIDPVSTGFSRPAEGEEKDQFHGYEEDLRSVGQFIHDYVTKYGRWRSPKFLIGESYGGLRSAGLSGHLRERYNMALNGILMVSPAINFQTLGFAPGNDLPYILFVPSYAATAWYHKALPGDLQQHVAGRGREASDRICPQRIHAGDDEGPFAERRGAQRRRRKAGALHRADEGICRAANLRIDMQRFGKELLRERGRTIGRYDSRFTGIDADSAGERPEYDPSGAIVFGPFTAAINDYLRNDLKVEDTPGLRNPDRQRAALELRPLRRGFPDATDTLRQTMSANPFMKLFCACGYYDLATPPATRDLQRRAHAAAAGAAARTSTSASTKAAT